MKAPAFIVLSSYPIAIAVGLSRNGTAVNRLDLAEKREQNG